MDFSAATVYKLERTLAPLGITLPDSAAAIAALHSEAHVAANTTASGDLTADIIADRVTAANVRERMRATMAAKTEQKSAFETLDDVEKGIVVRVRTWFTENGDSILDQVRDPFDSAAERLVNAVDVLGGVTDAEAVLDAGPTAVKAYAAQREAVATLHSIRDVRKVLERGGYDADSATAENADWWVETAVDAEDLANRWVLFKGSRFDVVAYTAAGYRVALNSAARAAEVRAEAAAGTARVAEEQRLACQARDPRIEARNIRAEAEARELARQAD